MLYTVHTDQQTESSSFPELGEYSCNSAENCCTVKAALGQFKKKKCIKIVTVAASVCQ